MLFAVYLTSLHLVESLYIIPCHPPSIILTSTLLHSNPFLCSLVDPVGDLASAALQDAKVEAATNAQLAQLPPYTSSNSVDAISTDAADANTEENSTNFLRSRAVIMEDPAPAEAAGTFYLLHYMMVSITTAHHHCHHGLMNCIHYFNSL
jgi:hypothetical protein